MIDQETRQMDNLLLPNFRQFQSVIDIAKEAGQQILEIYNSEDFKVSEKGDKSPLTTADLAAHRHISGALGDLTPAIPVLSEEGGMPSWAERCQWPMYWLIDPLDGTKEFINRTGEFTVNIALVVNHQAYFGVVHVPLMGVTYYGLVGEGAFKQVPDADFQAIQVKPHQAGETWKIVGSRRHGGDAVADFAEQLGAHELVPMGSSLKLCAVAEGTAHLYPRLALTSEWDTAAAQAVVEQAGGQVLTLDCQPLRYNAKEDILNPFFIVCTDDVDQWKDFLPKGE